jgi:hypothetical protein
MMLHTRRKKAKQNLVSLLVILAVTALSLFLELSQFNRYLDSLPDKNWEGLAAIGIVLFWVFFAVAAAICAILLLISIIGLFSHTQKTVIFTVLGIVAKLLYAVACILFAIVMYDAYPAGVTSKILYAVTAAAAITVSVLEIRKKEK